MRQVKVCTIPLLDEALLHQEDVNIKGEYLIEISDDVPKQFIANAALDIFHSNVRVKMPQNFIRVVRSMDGKTLSEVPGWEGVFQKYSGRHVGKINEKLDFGNEVQKTFCKIRLYVLPSPETVNEVVKDPYIGTYDVDAVAPAHLGVGLQAAALLAHQLFVITPSQYVVAIEDVRSGLLTLVPMSNLPEISPDSRCWPEKLNATWPGVYSANPSYFTSQKNNKDSLANEITLAASSEEEASEKANRHYSTTGIIYVGISIRCVYKTGAVLFSNGKPRRHAVPSKEMSQQQITTGDSIQSQQSTYEKIQKDFNSMLFPKNREELMSPSVKQAFEPTVIKTEQGGIVLRPGFVSSVSVTTMPGGELDDLLLHVQPYPVGSIENIDCPGEKVSIFFGCFGSFSDTLESTDELLARVGAYLGGVLLKNFVNEDLRQFITFEQYTQLCSVEGRHMVNILEKRGFLRRVK